MLMLEIGAHQNQDSAMTFLSALPQPWRMTLRLGHRRPSTELNAQNKSAHVLRHQALGRGLKIWMVSPRASIATNCSMRLARVSALAAVWIRHSIA